MGLIGSLSSCVSLLHLWRTRPRVILRIKCLTCMLLVDIVDIENIGNVHGIMQTDYVSIVILTILNGPYFLGCNILYVPTGNLSFLKNTMTSSRRWTFSLDASYQLLFCFFVLSLLTLPSFLLWFFHILDHIFSIHAYSMTPW